MADDGIVEYEVRVKAAQAIREVNELNASASSVPEVMANVQAAIEKTAAATGISFAAMKKEFALVEKQAQEVQASLGGLRNLGGAGQGTTGSIFQDLLAGLEPMFAGIIDLGTGLSAMNDQMRQGSVLAKDQAKSEAEVAAGINAQTKALAEQEAIRQRIITEIQQGVVAQDAAAAKAEIAQRERGIQAEQNQLLREAVNERKRLLDTADATQKEILRQAIAEREVAAARKVSLDAAQEEQMLVEKQGAALQQQLKTYGQVSRTTKETADYLAKFTGTQQGQSILSRFFGNYQQIQGANNQINVLKDSIAELSKATGTTFAQAGSVFEKQFSNIPGITQQTTRAVRELNGEFDRTSEKTKKAVSSIDAVRIALGALVAMLVFQVIQAVGNAFREFISNIREAELAVYNLVNAERRLSEQGVEITPAGLQEMIDKIKELAPILSEIQAQELVSRIATNVAPALHLTAEQIRQLAESIALLYVRNKALGKSFDEVEAQITNAFLTGRVSQGINQLGVKISDQIVKDEALRLGLVKSEKEFDNLSGEVEAHVKSVAMLSVVYTNATGDVESLGEYMETFDAQSQRAKTAWSDVLTILGEIFGPSLAALLGIIADKMELLGKRIETIRMPLQDVAVGFTALFNTFSKFSGMPLPVALIALLSHPGQTFKEFVENVKKADEALADLAHTMDTPTGENGPVPDEGDVQDLQDFIDKIEDIQESTREAFTDLNTKLVDKIEDINLEYQRKAVDAETDYLRKIEDINRDYEQNIQKIKDKQRDQDLKDEEKYQLQLWELRMRFLMNLEDALHARDARQIIRLQKEYALDKAVLEKKHALDTKQREEDQKAELEDAAEKRDRALADAKEAYNRKLQDQQIAKQREMEDLQTWYMRELQDLQTAQERKMQQLIKGWIDEQKITAENAAKVYGILLKYFGPGGLTDSLYAYMAQSLVAQTSMMGAFSSSAGGIAPARAGTSGGGSLGTRTLTSGGGGNRGRAEGGSIIATRPTTVTFGERGAEAALFLPMGRIGKNSGRMDLSGNLGGSGMDGTIVVQLDLSPDLEARVIENSMNGVAQVLTKINRSKF